MMDIFTIVNPGFVEGVMEVLVNNWQGLVGGVAGLMASELATRKLGIKGETNQFLISLSSAMLGFVAGSILK